MPRRRPPAAPPAPQPAADDPPLSTDLREVFAVAFKAAREAAGLSKSEVSRRTGIPRNILVAVEAGRQNLTLESVERLAQAVGQKGSDLLCPPP